MPIGHLGQGVGTICRGRRHDIGKGIHRREGHARGRGIGAVHGHGRDRVVGIVGTDDAAVRSRSEPVGLSLLRLQWCHPAVLLLKRRTGVESRGL